MCDCVCLCVSRFFKSGLGCGEGVNPRSISRTQEEKAGCTGQLSLWKPVLFLKCQSEQMVCLSFINHGLTELEGLGDHLV